MTILVYLGLLLALVAQLVVTGTYKKYARVKNKKGLTGKQVAEKILAQNKITGVKIIEATGFLGDYYHAGKKQLALSNSVDKNDSVAAVAVAAHECGHVIQDQTGYSFLRFRNALVPVVNFASYAGYIAIAIGLFFGNFLIELGILFELVILLFQVITLPVEFNASKRALQQLKQLSILTATELSQAEKVLHAAAFTYVASVMTILLQILRLLALANRRRN